MKKVVWVVGLTYVVLFLHLAVIELLKLSDNRWAPWIIAFAVLDSLSIGWTVWKAMKKAEAARAGAGSQGEVIPRQ